MFFPVKEDNQGRRPVLLCFERQFCRHGLRDHGRPFVQGPIMLWMSQMSGPLQYILKAPRDFEVKSEQRFYQISDVIISML